MPEVDVDKLELFVIAEDDEDMGYLLTTAPRQIVQEHIDELWEKCHITDGWSNDDLAAELAKTGYVATVVYLERL